MDSKTQSAVMQRMIASTSRGVEGGAEAVDDREHVVRARVGRTSPAAGVAGRRRARGAGPRPDDAGATIIVLHCGEPAADRGDELVVEAEVVPGRDRQVPGMDEVVGGELSQVFLGRSRLSRSAVNFAVNGPWRWTPEWARE